MPNNKLAVRKFNFSHVHKGQLLYETTSIYITNLTVLCIVVLVYFKLTFAIVNLIPVINQWYLDKITVVIIIINRNQIIYYYCLLITVYFADNKHRLWLLELLRHCQSKYCIASCYTVHKIYVNYSTSMKYSMIAMLFTWLLPVHFNVKINPDCDCG